MPQTNNIITPVERLKIAAQLLAGMQAPSYLPAIEVRKSQVKSALASADELINQSGCIVEREYQDEEEDAVPCMHQRIGSDRMTSGSYCLDCGEEF